MTHENARLEEIEEVYRILEQESEEFQEFFDALSLETPENFIFIECGNTFDPEGTFENA